MQIPIPRLILHQEAATLLCQEHSTSGDEVEPLTSTTHINVGSDDDSSPSRDEESNVSDDSTASTSDETTRPTFFRLRPAHIDVEAQAVDDAAPEVSPLGVASPTSDGSLFYSNDEVHAFGKTRTAVEQTVKGAEKITKKTIQGAAKGTRIATKKTGKVARKAATTAAQSTRVATRATVQATKKTTKGVVGLPHEASRHWTHCALLVTLQAVGPVVVSLPTPLTMLHSVNDGLSHNRGFLYGTHTLVELFVLSPFIATCHYAIGEAKIPLETRVMAVLVGLGFGKLALAFIAEAWWSPHAETVFPIPFSFIVTMVFSIPFSMFTLWLLTPSRNCPSEGHKIRRRFKLCFLLLGCYMLSLIVACLWAVKFRQLADKPVRQTFWVIFYQIMEFILKILFGANLTTRLNAQRWLQLNLVIDLIFASVQTAMLPYFASWVSVSISVFSTMAFIAWRSYAGVDRLQRFLPSAKDIIVNSATKPKKAAAGIGKLAHQMTVSPVKEITPTPMSTRLIGNGANGGLPDWDDVEDDESIDIEAGKQKIERTSTEETDTLSDSESTDSQAADEEESPPKIDRRAAFRNLKSSHQSQEPKIDRRAAFKNQKSLSIRKSILQEVSEEQRHLYHIVDSVSSAILVTVVRLAAVVTSIAIRNLPIASDHLNTSFQISDEQWRHALIYAVVFIVGVVFVLLGTGCYLKRGAELGGLTLNRVISYVFRDSYWFFFFWFCITQHLSIAIQLNHFGADFTLKFDWLTCREEGLMDWPGCVAMEPSV